MNAVYVFRTSVSGSNEVRQLQPELNGILNRNGHWNFDLEDCDNILRVETSVLRARAIASVLHKAGFECEELL
jgi:hypothetical protein